MRGAASESDQHEAEQGAAPDRLQPALRLVPRLRSGFRRRVSLVVVPVCAAWMYAIIKTMEAEVIKGDLLDQKVDAIVNAWNRNIIPWWLLLPQGVSGAIKRRAGLQPFREVAKFGPIPLGQAVLTSAGKLPFRGIIHVAGINGFWRASEYSIRQSVHDSVVLERVMHFVRWQSKI